METILLTEDVEIAEAVPLSPLLLSFLTRPVVPALVARSPLAHWETFESGAFFLNSWKLSVSQYSAAAKLEMGKIL